MRVDEKKTDIGFMYLLYLLCFLFECDAYFVWEKIYDLTET